EEPQEEEDIDIDDEEDENEPELMFPYNEADPLNLSPQASNLEPEDVIKVEDTVEPRTRLFLLVSMSVEEGAAAMENLVRKLGNAKERAECKKLKKELEEARLSNTLLLMFQETLNEAIDVPVEDKESPLSKPRGYPRDY
ncbi:hypothetical protein Tco_0277797, partial [Tanacetum coccineum]